MDWLLDDEPMIEAFNSTPWKIAVVDDDPEIHKITNLTLKDFEFEDRHLRMLQAYSGQEAKELFRQHNDIAIVLLDVIMESEESGLEVIKFIREELGNHYTRIILRTGQSGSFLEDDVIREYDIDGFRAKTDLTKQNLTQLFYTNLRSYRDINNLQRYRKGQKALIASMSSLAQIDRVNDFAGALMQQLSTVLNSNETEFIMQDSEAFALAKHKANRWHIMVNEEQTELLAHGERSDNNRDFVEIAERALSTKQSLFEPPLYAHYYKSDKNLESVFILRNSQLLSDFNQHLLQLFSKNAVIMLEHLFDRQEPN